MTTRLSANCVPAAKGSGAGDIAPASSRRGSGIRRAVLLSQLPPPSETLAAAFTFLEGVASRRLGRDELRAWLERSLVAPGHMPRTLRVQEPIFGALASDKGCRPFLPDEPPPDETAAILVRARARVVGHLRGLLAIPADDRFLSAAIFAGRVRRVVVDEDMMWVPRPRSHDILSDIVTSLFVADILGRRGFYAQNLCVCDTCGRVGFDPEPPRRDRCFFC